MPLSQAVRRMSMCKADKRKDGGPETRARENADGGVAAPRRPCVLSSSLRLALDIFQARLARWACAGDWTFKLFCRFTGSPRTLTERHYRMPAYFRRPAACIFFLRSFRLSAIPSPLPALCRMALAAADAWYYSQISPYKGGFCGGTPPPAFFLPVLSVHRMRWATLQSIFQSLIARQPCPFFTV